MRFRLFDQDFIGVDIVRQEVIERVLDGLVFFALQKPRKLGAEQVFPVDVFKPAARERQRLGQLGQALSVA